MSLTGHRMPPRTTQQSHRPRVSDRTMVGTLPPRCLQALPHGTKNAATDGPGYRATPRSTTEPHRGWMSDTYLLHLHAEGEKCFLLTSPFIEPRLRYIHRNPVKRGLVEEPQDWPWSSFRHYLSGAEGVVEIDSQWTALKRGRMGVMPQIGVQSQIPRPCHCKGRSDKDGATSSVEMKGKGWASLPSRTLTTSKTRAYSEFP